MTPESWRSTAPNHRQRCRPLPISIRPGSYYTSINTEVRPSFIAGALAVMQGSIAGGGGITKDAAFKFSVHPFPTFPDKQRLMNSGGSFIGVYARDDEQKKATWDFIKFVISQEGMDIWMKTGYLNSTTFEVPLLPGRKLPTSS